MIVKYRPTALAIIAMAWRTQTLADWTHARCNIYPKGSDHTDKMILCVLSWGQGFVTIVRDDGVTHDLVPYRDAAGNYRDRNGRPVYRQRTDIQYPESEHALVIALFDIA